MTEMLSDRQSRVVTLTKRIEGERRLDGLTRLLEPTAKALLADPRRAAALRGRWLSHAIHPLMTDVPLGMWTSAIVLDLVGGPDGRTAARRLIGLGIASAVPTAVTGMAEWGATEGEDVRRVGAVHAAANSTALMLFVVSYAARRRDRQAAGVAASLLAGLAATVGGYLGGHLIEVRKVASYHPGYDRAATTDAPTR